MPTYDYQCEKCSHKFEKFQNITDNPLSTCPKCGEPLRRLIGPGAGVIYKGRSFSNNDDKYQTRCGGGQTCCGRHVPCDTPPCEK